MDPSAEQVTDTATDVAPAGSPELRGQPDWDAWASAAAETEWQGAELAALAAVVRIANRRA